jgi:hypothetical protein
MQVFVKIYRSVRQVSSVAEIKIRPGSRSARTSFGKISESLLDPFGLPQTNGGIKE